MGLRQRLSNTYMKYTPDGLFALSYNVLYADKKHVKIIKAVNYADSWVIEGMDNGDIYLVSPTPKFLNVHLQHFESVFEKHFKILPTDVCLDVGACIGDTTKFMAIKTKGGGKTIGVEPDPKNAKYLRRNLSLYPHASVIEKAAWNKMEKLPFYTNYTLTSNSILNHTTGMKKEYVQADTIDNMLMGMHVNFAKIDVQGTELQALQGADNLLKTADKIIVETHWRTIKGKATYPQVLEFMKNYQFKHFKFELETGLVYAWRV